MSEPRKLKPKMTVVEIPASLSDGEIMASIAEKSTDIKEFVNKDCTLKLCFTKTKGNYEHAEIHSLISKRNEQIYVGSNSCKAYDRYWVTQCYQCQGFGHMSSKCSRKEESPTSYFVLAIMSQEPALIDHHLTVATVLPWRITLAQWSILLQVWTVQ